MNWKDERGKNNYCGYCIDYTCVCDGNCFVEERFNPEENKLDHLNSEIKISEKRLRELKKELKNLKNGN